MYFKNNNADVIYKVDGCYNMIGAWVTCNRSVSWISVDVLARLINRQPDELRQEFEGLGAGYEVSGFLKNPRDDMRLLGVTLHDVMIRGSESSMLCLPTFRCMVVLSGSRNIDGRSMVLGRDFLFAFNYRSDEESGCGAEEFDYKRYKSNVNQYINYSLEFGSTNQTAVTEKSSGKIKAFMRAAMAEWGY